MSREEDGGAAFPSERLTTTGKQYQHHAGMTLRDWFAGLAMQGFAADPASHALFDDMPDMARSAYEAADAMITARSK